MGAQPKKKISSSRRGKRYSSKKIQLKELVHCSNCKSLKQRHLVCPTCGQYSGKQIFEKKEEVKVSKIAENK